jgi:hypothetical protein
MKRKLLLLGCILGTALFTNALNAQINFTENFEGTISWSGTEFFESDNLPCEGSSSYVSDLHGGFVSNGSDTTISPSLGTSDGTPVTFMYSYKVLNSMTSQPALNSNNWGSITVSWGTSASGPWTPIETINTGNHSESTSCAERTLNFTPAAGSEVYIRFYTELNDFSNFIHIYIDDITATQECTTEAPQPLLIEQNFCGSDTIGEIQVGAQGEVVWYATETSDTPLDNDALITTTTYYAAQIVDGCESEERASVTINLTIVGEPEGDDTQEFVHSDEMPFMMPFSALNIDNLEGATVTWYMTEEDAEAGENGHTEDDIFTESGVYYVTQTINGCTSVPFAVTVTVTLGSEDFFAENLKVYPNPVKDVITVSYAEDIMSIAIYNIVGQLVMVKEINAAEAHIDLSPLTTGTYLVKIASGEAVKTVKIIKQ